MEIIKSPYLQARLKYLVLPHGLTKTHSVAIIHEHLPEFLDLYAS